MFRANENFELGYLQLMQRSQILSLSNTVDRLGRWLSALILLQVMSITCFGLALWAPEIGHLVLEWALKTTFTSLCVCALVATNFFVIQPFFQFIARSVSETWHSASRAGFHIYIDIHGHMSMIYRHNREGVKFVYHQLCGVIQPIWLEFAERPWVFVAIQHARVNYLLIFSARGFASCVVFMAGLALWAGITFMIHRAISATFPVIMTFM